VIPLLNRQGAANTTPSVAIGQGRQDEFIHPLWALVVPQFA
jgi:hypothetical protein